MLWKVNVHAGYLKTSKIKKERELEQAAQSPAAEEEKVGWTSLYNVLTP